MNDPIMLTPSDLIGIFLGICAAIVSISAAVAVIAKIIQKAKEPEKNQNTRLDDIEKKVHHFEELFDKDNRRIKELEDGNREIQKALLALLSHSINGNDIDKLSKARDDLQSYLIERSVTL